MLILITDFILTMKTMYEHILCINFFSDHPVCNEIIAIKGTNFPSNKFNVVFHAKHKNLSEEFVIVNHRVVFIDKNQTACIWWHETGFWWIGT